MHQKNLILRRYHLTREQDHRLRALARKEGITQEEVFRRLVHPAAPHADRSGDRPSLKIIRTFEVDEECDFTLDGRASSLGITKNELVRRILDKAFENA